MANIQGNALIGIRNYFKKMISYARYQIGTTWYKVEIESVTTYTVPKAGGATEYHVVFRIVMNGPGTVSKVELYDRNGAVIYSKSESLVIANITEGYSYEISIRFVEVIE